MDSEDHYQIPSYPRTELSRDFFNTIFGDISQRLAEVEAKKADFEAMEAGGVQASLDYIQVTLGPQLEGLQQQVGDAQAAIEDLLNEGIAPDAAKLGGEDPEYYATKQSVDDLENDFDQSVLNIGNAIERKAPLEDPTFTGAPTAPTPDPTAEEDEIATAAFVKTFGADMMRYSEMELTAAQQGQGRANLDVGILTGFRNEIINGDFDFWKRGLSQTNNGLNSCDRHSNYMSTSGVTRTVSRQSFTLGQTAVPGNPRYYHRTEITAATGTGTAGTCSVFQRLEDVQQSSGKRKTFTIWAKASAAGKFMSIEGTQFFGTGGTPSSEVTGIGTQKLALTPSWQKFSVVLDFPSVAGKLLGTNGDDNYRVVVWFSAGPDYSLRSSSLGHQTGVFDIAHLSLVDGDATAESNPFPFIPSEIDELRCLRFFEAAPRLMGRNYGTSTATIYIPWNFLVRKRAPPNFSNVVTTSGLTASIASDSDNQLAGVMVNISNVPAGTTESTRFGGPNIWANSEFE